MDSEQSSVHRAGEGDESEFTAGEQSAKDAGFELNNIKPQVAAIINRDIQASLQSK